MVFDGERPISVPADIVLAAQREYRAYLAHQSGEGWDTIAVREQWATPEAARAAVRRYLKEGGVLASNWTRAEMFAIEIARLNALQTAVWEGAMEGKIPAVAMARQIIRDRIELLGLDQETDDAGLKARTVVVYAEDEESYIASLASVVTNEGSAPTVDAETSPQEEPT